MRGDAPYMALLRGGEMTVYRIGLEDDLKAAAVPVESEGPSRTAVIPCLANERPGLNHHKQWISDVILRLLTTALDDLISTGVAETDAISLVGRALFVRFLADRGLMPPALFALPSAAEDCWFQNSDQTVAVSRWLDETFNGDFLPLSAETIRGLPAAAFRVASDVLRRADGRQLQLGWQIAWDRLDFAHIPVGVLSQAYERYLSRHEQVKQHQEGSYYTPRHIADLMVRASFNGLRDAGGSHTARILDPAAGAGVFLITCFRQLVAERWRESGKRPDTTVLREILYNQITGFDINESALRFAALGLYLISIELDSHPEPVQKLAFKNLRPSVLKMVGVAEDGPSKALGSLGVQVGGEHEGAYDLVIGNPPWSRATGLRNWSEVEALVHRVAVERTNDPAVSAPLPGAVVDLPFVWRAMEWARPGGQIAFALHARVLFQRKGMEDARRALFQSLDVTGIINGTELRQTKVWPEVQAPFCLLFARNAVPAPGAAFRFVSPRLEDRLNKTGIWRIDVSNAPVVGSEEVVERPELLKTLFRGSRLDVELHDKLRSRGLPTFGEHWAQLFGGTPSRPLHSGIGYKKTHSGSASDPHTQNLRGYAASEIAELPTLPKSGYPGFIINSASYPTLAELGIARLDRVRSRELYRAPLLLMNECPPEEHGRLRTSVSFRDISFSQSYHGYSAASRADGEDIVKYLALLLGTKLSMWHALITSGRFGFERPVVEKDTINQTPVPPFASLSARQRSQAADLFELMAVDNSESNWLKVDDWAVELYGLSADDAQVISDTLRYNLPFGDNGSKAQQPVDAQGMAAFTGRLKSEIEPWAERLGKHVVVRALNSPPLSPWRFLYLGYNEDLFTEVMTKSEWAGIVQLAEQASSAEFTYVDDSAKCLLVGRLSQARYWSVSQARLYARKLVWDHTAFLDGHG